MCYAVKTLFSQNSFLSFKNLGLSNHHAFSVCVHHAPTIPTFPEVDLFSLNLVRALCYRRSYHCHTSQFPTATNDNMMDEQNYEVGPTLMSVYIPEMVT
jgi:hypothetical protein